MDKKLIISVIKWVCMGNKVAFTNRFAAENSNLGDKVITGFDIHLTVTFILKFSSNL